MQSRDFSNAFNRQKNNDRIAVTIWQVLDRLGRPRSQGITTDRGIGLLLILDGLEHRKRRRFKNSGVEIVQIINLLWKVKRGANVRFLMASKRLLTNTFYCCIQTFRDIRETSSSLAGRWKLGSLRSRRDGAWVVLGRAAKVVWDSSNNGSGRNQNFTAQIN